MNLHVFDHSSAMSAAAAEWITEYIEQHLRVKKTFSLLLSGGNTPKELYTLLANDTFRNRIDWKKIEIFFGDERFVPFDDQRNNGKMAYDILLKHVPVPSEQIHYMPANISIEASAIQYEKILHEYFSLEENTFDLALLGIGNDGHTLSLFPGSKTIHEQSRWVVPSQAPDEPKQRITLTPWIVNQSECIIFLVTGKAKAAVLEKVIHGEYNPDLYPAQIIRDRPKSIHWFADREAMDEVLKNKE